MSDSVSILLQPVFGLQSLKLSVGGQVHREILVYSLDWKPEISPLFYHGCHLSTQTAQSHTACKGLNRVIERAEVQCGLYCTSLSWFLSVLLKLSVMSCYLYPLITSSLPAAAALCHGV